MLNYEKKYEGKIITGIDEAGRGPLAGPVVCACVIMPLQADKIIDGVNDSKKLSPKKREALYEKIIETAIDFSIVEVDEKTIDEINILQATRLGMKKALEGLKIKPDIVLIDAVKIDTDLPQDSIIHGDALSYNIAAASILAKVHVIGTWWSLTKSIQSIILPNTRAMAQKRILKHLKNMASVLFTERVLLKTL